MDGSTRTEFVAIDPLFRTMALFKAILEANEEARVPNDFAVKVLDVAKDLLKQQEELDWPLDIDATSHQAAGFVLGYHEEEPRLWFDGEPKMQDTASLNHMAGKKE